MEKDKENKSNLWIKIATIIISLLTVLLNYQIFRSNQRLKDIETAQKNQQVELEKQRLIMQQQKEELNIRLNLYDRIIQSVGKSDPANNDRELRVLIALVKSIPESEYSTALLNILADSSKRDIKDAATDELKARLSRGGEWIYRPSTKQNEGFPDYDIFICEPALGKNNTQNILTSILKVFDDRERIGRIRIKMWDNYSEFSNKDLKDKFTVITDKNHKEKQDAEAIMNKISKKVSGLPEVAYRDNPGKNSPWLITIVLCPSESE